MSIRTFFLNDKPTKKQILLFFFVLILLNIVLRFPSFYTTFLDIDEAQNGYFAWSVLNGRTPYLDIVGDKPFLHYYFFQICFQIFGEQNYEGMHFFLLIWVILQVYYLYKIGSLFGNRWIGLLSAFFYTIFSTCSEPKIIAASAELISNLPQIMGFYYFLLFWKYKDNGKNSYFYLILSALILGLAFNTSLKYGINIVIVGLTLLIFFVVLNQKRWTSYINEISNGLIFLVFFLFPHLITTLYIYSIGALEPYQFWLFTYNFHYISLGSETIPLTKGIIRTLLWILFTFTQCLFAYYTIRSIFTKKYWNELKVNSLTYEKKIILFSFIWLIFSYLAVTSGKRFYGHYFIQAFPALAVLGSISAYNFLKSVSKKMDRLSILKKRLFILGVVIPPLLFLIPKLDQKVLFYDLFFVEYPDYKTIGKYIKNNSEKSYSIYVWGFATPIYYYANREVAGRYSWSDFLVGRVPGSPINNDPDYDTSQFQLDQAWKDFFVDMKRFKPIYFVDTSSAKIHDYGKYPIYNYPELMTWLNKHYQFEKKVKGVDLYKRIAK